jgi:transposase InsO family protein
LERAWHAHWARRHAELARRREADAGWRREREEIRQQARALGDTLTAAWIAVLVVVDNCTRRSLGLPLFVAGAHVTAEMVTQALAALLPKGLAYLIADGGAHFTADVVKELEGGRGIVRVPLAKHRPRSNGIAERFIETLKTWLAGKEWQSAEELAALLGEFVTEYNDRPHQGRELAGLAPNEFAARLGVI